jgi:hypothetical protein
MRVVFLTMTVNLMKSLYWAELLFLYSTDSSCRSLSVKEVMGTSSFKIWPQLGPSVILDRWIGLNTLTVLTYETVSRFNYLLKTEDKFFAILPIEIEKFLTPS